MTMPPMRPRIATSAGRVRAQEKLPSRTYAEGAGEDEQ